MQLHANSQNLQSARAPTTSRTHSRLLLHALLHIALQSNSRTP